MRTACVWILMFLLTASLILFGVSFAFRRAAAPALAPGGAALSADAAEREQELIRERITELAALYGFSAERALACVDAETLADLNSQAALWWKGVVQDGVSGDEPTWDTEPLRQALLSDPALAEGRGADEAEVLAGEAAKAVRQSVIRVVLPIRLPVFGKALAEAGKKVDLPNIVRFLLDLPWTALALSALLAGLIALLEIPRPGFGLCHIGAPLGGAALVLALLIILLGTSGAEGLIREASESLAGQYGSLVSGVMLRSGILSALLMIGCAACLLLGRRNGAAHE